MMPDGHVGIGAAVGAVTATVNAVIPAVTGVDLGCGMIAVRTSLSASQLPDNANQTLFDAISKAVPHGNTKGVGQWTSVPKYINAAWGKLYPKYKEFVEKHGKASLAPAEQQLGTLGGGNHFIEICLDEEDRVWVMLHSGSRGVGNKIGSHFIELAKRDMERHQIRLPNKDLAYLKEGSDHFEDYVKAVNWCQDYARVNREMMLRSVIDAMRKSKLPQFTLTDEAVNCHHNYVQKETHFGQEVFVTRKGAVSAREGEMGIIPGSMGAKSYIVRGKGNPESFHSCSHGAGRVMSRGVAKKNISLERHKEATKGVVCRLDEGVLDESPDAYKDIDAVMAAQTDLVEVVHTLKQIVCVKG